MPVEKSVEGFQINVSATENDTHPFAGASNSTVQYSRGGNATRRFDDNLHTLGKEAHGLDQLHIAHRDDVVNIAFQDRKIMLSEIGRQRAVSNGFRHRNTHDLAPAQ